jgi:hypothetical protein
VIVSPTGRQLGDALESACIHWLQMRIAVAMSGGEESIKLSELFAIEPADDDHEIFFFNEKNHCLDEILFPRLCEGHEKFLAAFNAIQYSSQMFMSIDGQQWDHAYDLHTGWSGWRKETFPHLYRLQIQACHHGIEEM